MSIISRIWMIILKKKSFLITQHEYSPHRIIIQLRFGLEIAIFFKLLHFKCIALIKILL